MKMKNVFGRMVIVMIAAAVVLCSCGKDDDPVKEPEVPVVPEEPEVPTDMLPVITDADYVFSSEAGAYTLEVAATVKWKAVSSSDWLKIDKTSGTDKVDLAVTVDENTTGAERKGMITITNTADNKVIFTFGVTQAAVSYVINVSGEDAEIPAAGGFIVLEVEANKDYALEMEEWVAEVPAETNAAYGTARSSLKFYIGTNPLTVVRTSKVTVKDGEEVKKTVNLRQLASDAPVVEEPEVLPDTLIVDLDEAVGGVLQIPAEGGVITAVSRANRDYDVYLTAWMKKQQVTNAVYAGDLSATTMYIAVDANMTSIARQADLVFEANGDNPLVKEFKIVQEPVTIQVELENGAVALPAKANVSTPLIITMPKKLQLEGVAMTEFMPEGDIIKDETVKDKNVYKITVRCLYANPATNTKARLLALRLKTEEGFKYDWNVMIKQFGVPNFAIDMSGMSSFFPAQAVENFELKVNIKVDEGGEVPEGLGYIMEVNESWIHAEKSAADPMVVVVAVDDNPEYQERKGTIIFKFDDPEYTFTYEVLIVQKAKEMEYELVVNDQRITEYSATSCELVTAKRKLPVAENEDVTYYVKMEVVGEPVYFISTSGIETTSKVVEFFVQSNTTPDERVETLVAKIMKRIKSSGEEEVIYTTPEFKVIQPGKPAVQKITASIKGGNTTLKPEGQAPVQLEVSGADAYKIVIVSGGKAYEQYLKYDAVPNEYGVIFVWQAIQGPPPSLIYVLPAGEDWKAENVENYGKIEGLTW